MRTRLVETKGCPYCGTEHSMLHTHCEKDGHELKKEKKQVQMREIDFTKKPIFGMIHLAGNPERADEEIEIFELKDVDGIIIENYHGTMNDILKVLKFRDEINPNVIIGLNILPNEFELAFSLAHAYDLDFIQLDYIAGVYKRPTGATKRLDVTTYMRFREKFPHIKVLGGVWPKYYEPVDDSNLSTDLDEAMELCDAIVVTGEGTGKETPLDKIKRFRNIVGDSFPLIIGAGLDKDNVVHQLPHADGAIVGSAFKQYKQTTNPVSHELVEEFMTEVKKVR